MAKSGRTMKDEGVKIMLDKERELRFDLNALEALEEQGISIDKAFAALETRSVKMCKALLYATLVHEEEGNEDFTPKFVGRIVGVGDILMAFDKLSESLMKSMPENDDDEGNETGK